MTDLDKTLKWLQKLNINFSIYEPECYAYIDIYIDKSEMTTLGRVIIRFNKKGKYLSFASL